MAQLTCAFLALLAGYAKALFTPARGRHSAAARRRRSTRVRRYAPVPAPVEATAPPAPKPVPAPRLALPRESFPAEDTALVRPYLASHERDLDRVQAEATARLHSWALRKAPPASSGDLLADPVEPKPGEFDELAALVRIREDQLTRQNQRQAVAA